MYDRKGTLGGSVESDRGYDNTKQGRPSRLSTPLHKDTQLGGIHYDFDSGLTQPSIPWASAMADALQHSSGDLKCSQQIKPPIGRPRLDFRSCCPIVTRCLSPFFFNCLLTSVIERDPYLISAAAEQFCNGRGQELICLLGLQTH